MTSPVPATRWLLVAALAALALLFVGWFWQDRHWLAAMLVFALPPVLLLASVLRGRRAAVFWSAVLALGWFSHGVMVAYARPPERVPAVVEIVLALGVIAAASWRGLRARFGRKREP